MKTAGPPPLLRRLALRSPVAMLVLAAACVDDGAAPPTASVTPGRDGLLGVLQCEVRVASSDMTCVDASGPLASASRAVAGGPSLVQRTFGGQGTYVRLANSGNALAAGVYSMNVTVQNLANLAMGTEDGATRHGEGVRIFFSTLPHTTGGEGDVTIANATGTAFFTAANQPYFQYGGSIGGTDQPELGGDGVLASAETSSALPWQFNLDAGVTRFAFVVLVRTQTAPGSPATVAPQVTGTSVATLVPGQTVTLTGLNFNATPGNNVVRIGGVQATVTGGGATSLNVVVPCVASGPVAVQVQQGGMAGVAVQAPLQANQRTLSPGQAVVVTNAADVGCNELTPTGASTRYVVAVYNTSTSPISTTAFQISGDGTGPAVPAPSAAHRPSLSVAGAPLPGARQALEQARREDDAHLRVMEFNRRANEELRARFGRDARMRPSSALVTAAAVPPTTGTFRVVDLNGSSCNDHYTVNATRVYYNGKLAIYEDNANPIVASGPSANATLAAYYTAIGDQYNADMEPVVRTSFGDPLLRDAVTDNNGVLIALFTNGINTNAPGVAGFVISCDQYPNGPGNQGSNFGEYFYAMVPTSTTAGYGSSATMDSWYRTIRATFIHETKHVASQAARVNAGAPFESAWLEEGTARHAEELWARTAVYNVPWKGNTGYGSAAAPNSIYCDVRPSTAACNATDPARPSLNMWRHFSALYTFMREPHAYSPFGGTAAGGTSFYATSWSLVRYAIDRYGASDAAFLTALTSSSSTGTANLAARAGVPIEQVMGGWALALYADDYPGLATPSADIQMPTWDFGSIYTGFATDFGLTNYPITPQALSFGFAGPVSVPSIAGGGVSYFVISGTQSLAQMLNLQGAGGGALPSTLRVAIARLQ